jgi:glycosyltransferase involved in cell wall biosynthesis
MGILSKFYGRRVKGEALLFELAKRLNPEDIMFTLVGEDRIVTKKMLEGFGFEVDLFENIPYRIFNEIYHSIDVLLMASLFEGGPANIPEALYTGTPILASKVGMVYDFLIPGVNGLELTGNASVDSLRISNLANNRNNEFGELKSAMREYNQEIPTWKDVVDKYQQVYQGMK